MLTSLVGLHDQRLTRQQRSEGAPPSLTGEYQVDVLLGDVTWETSYGLPGEGSPPRVQADITLDWPTWSQTADRHRDARPHRPHHRTGLHGRR